MGHLNIQRTCLILIEQIIEFVVRCAIYSGLVRSNHTLIVVAEDALVVAQVGRRLLEAIIIRKGSLNLVHVQGAIEVVKATLLQVFVK